MYLEELDDNFNFVHKNNFIDKILWFLISVHLKDSF